MSGALRFNEGKPKLGYFARSFPKMLEAVARVKEFGANKYNEGNWRLGNKPDEEYIDSMYRHLDCFLKGEHYDEDSACLHLGHAVWNLCALLELNYPDLPAIDAERFAERMAHWAEKKREREQAPGETICDDGSQCCVNGCGPTDGCSDCCCDDSGPCKNHGEEVEVELPELAPGIKFHADLSGPMIIDKLNKHMRRKAMEDAAAIDAALLDAFSEKVKSEERDSATVISKALENGWEFTTWRVGGHYYARLRKGTEKYVGAGRTLGIASKQAVSLIEGSFQERS